MPSAVIVETRPRRSAARPAFVAAGAVAAAALIWFVVTLTDPPATIPRLTIVNPSSVDVEIDVAPARGAGALDLGHVTPRATRTIRDVLDQGSTWVFDIRSPGSALAELAVDRDELARNDWTVRLPADLGDQEAR